MTIPTTRRLTGKDLLATAAIAAAGALYAWHLTSSGTGLLHSPRFLSLALLVLGVTACAVAGSYTAGGRYPTVMSWAAAAAFALSVAGMISGSGLPLAALALALGLMWLVTTARHALGIYPLAPAPSPDGSHEALRAAQHQRL